MRLEAAGSGEPRPEEGWIQRALTSRQPDPVLGGGEEVVRRRRQRRRRRGGGQRGGGGEAVKGEVALRERERKSGRERIR